MAEQIRRVLVWSGWLRVAHWALAGATLWLMVTGWLVANSPALAASAAEWHYLAAGLLVFAVGLRLFVGFFGRGAERFEHLLPQTTEFAAMRASLVFCLSFGKSPLPNWFAHNPLWKPIYLFLYLLLGLLALSGWLMPDMPLLWRFYLPHVHATLATMVTIIAVAHLYCVVLHDLKGRNADTSAMINGHRYFTIDRQGLAEPDLPPVSISVDELTRPGRSERDD